MILRAIACSLLACGLGFAQMPNKAPKVTAVPVDKVTVRQGGKSKVHMTFEVAPGYHINSHQPVSELLIPTTISLDVPTNVSMAGMDYPQGRLMTFPFSPDEKLSVYTGDFTVTGTVMAAKDTPKGTYRVHGNLRYQACDNRACYPPTNIPIMFDVAVVKGTTAHTRRNPGQSPHIHH